MIGRYARWFVFVAAAAAAALVGCGDETAIWVEVDLGGRIAGTQVDLIHLELREEGASLIGRNFPLMLADTRPSIELTPGGRLPNSFEIVAYAYLDGSLQGESPALTASFVDGERTRVTVRIPQE